MTVLPRLKPDPIPEIHPLPERLATGQRLSFYQDTKAALQVPWMGVVTMAFAHYPHFYGTLWQALNSVTQSEAFLTACTELRAFTEADLPTQPALASTLIEMGYDAVELAQIRDLIEVFSHGNMPYILIATIARLLLEGHELSGDTALIPSTKRHGPAPDTPLLLMEKHHADTGLAATYADLEESLGLPFVNTDYRALARWPSYFTRAWQDLRAVVIASDYEQRVAAIHDKAVALALTLPNPSGLTPDQLQAAAAKDGDEQLVRETVQLFQWLLPGLLFNVAILQAQLPHTD